jgi:hypothetical protein
VSGLMPGLGSNMSTTGALTMCRSMNSISATSIR